MGLINSLRTWNERRLASRRVHRALMESSKLKLAVMGIMKNEALNLDEWITHYKEQGADKIFLIDNGSTDDSVQIAWKYAIQGLVECIVLPQRHQQTQHYHTALKKFKIPARFQWLLIADLDEFWFCKDGTPVSSALDQYQEFDLIYVNWSVFGSSNHDQHPDSLRRRLVHRMEAIGSHTNTKYIVRPCKIKTCHSLDIHKVRHIDSDKVISDNERFQINHYVTQSMEFFTQVKLKRGDAAASVNDRVRDMAYFKQVEEACCKIDDTLAKRVAS